MKKQTLLAGLFLFLVPVVLSQDLQLSEILAKHYKALGYENLLKINTMVMSGTMIQQDAMPVRITRKRPDLYVMEFDVQDVTAWQAYDGKTAWMTAPWTGNPKPQVMAEDRARDLRTKADFDGLLYDWKTKGHIVEVDGRDTVDQSPAYKLKVTKTDGGVEYLSIDAKTFLITRRLYHRTIRGQEVPVENYFRDYRAVGGILFAFTQDTFFGGQPYNSLQLESVELNVPVEEKVFRMPGQ